MIIGLIDNHSPALTPQEMSDFDQMDSIGEYSGDEVSFTPIPLTFRPRFTLFHPDAILGSSTFHPRFTPFGPQSTYPRILYFIQTTDASIDYELGPSALRKNNEIGFEDEKFTQTKSELPRLTESPIGAGQTDTRAADVNNAGHDGISPDGTNESIIDLEATETKNKKDFWEDVYEKVDVLEKSGFRNTAREDLFNELKGRIKAL